MVPKHVVSFCLLFALVSQINTQGLISSFQDFALINNPMDTGTTKPDQGMPNDPAFPSDPFPPDNTFPVDTAFPSDNAFPPDSAFPPDTSGLPTSGKDSGVSGSANLNAGSPDGATIPVSSVDIASQIGLVNGQSEVNPGFSTQTGNDRGTVITLEPIKNDHFLPSIPPGGQFVNLISGITNNFEPQSDWLNNNQAVATPGESLDPSTTGTAADPVTDNTGVMGSNQAAATLETSQPGIPVNLVDMQPLVPGSDVVPTATLAVPGQPKGPDPVGTLDHIPTNAGSSSLDPVGIIDPVPSDPTLGNKGNIDLVSVGPDLGTVGSIDSVPGDPGITAVEGGQDPGGVVLGVANPPSVNNMLDGAIASPDSTNLIPVDLLPGATQDGSADPLAGTIVDTAAQEPSIQPLDSTGGTADQLQMPDTYNLMARASIHNFSKNRDLTRQLRNIRRKARKDWQQKRRQQSGRGRQNGNSQNRKGPRGAQVARMVLPGSRRTVVGKNTRGRVGRGNSAPCTRRRELLGLCSSGTTRLKRSAFGTDRTELLGFAYLNKRRIKRQVVFQSPPALAGASVPLIGRVPQGTLPSGGSNIGGLLNTMASSLIGGTGNTGGHGLLGSLQQGIRNLVQQGVTGVHSNPATLLQPGPVIGPTVLGTVSPGGAVNTGTGQSHRSLLDMLPESGKQSGNPNMRSKGGKVKNQSGSNKANKGKGGNSGKGQGKKFNSNQWRGKGRSKTSGMGGGPGGMGGGPGGMGGGPGGMGGGPGGMGGGPGGMGGGPGGMGGGRGGMGGGRGGMGGGRGGMGGGRGGKGVGRGGKGVGRSGKGGGRGGKGGGRGGKGGGRGGAGGRGKAGGSKQKGQGVFSGPEGGRLLGAPTQLTNVDPAVTSVIETHGLGTQFGGGGSKFNQRNRQVKIKPPKEKGAAELTPVNLASLDALPAQQTIGGGQNIMTGSGSTADTGSTLMQHSGSAQNHADPLHGSEPRNTEIIDGFGTIDWTPVEHVPDTSSTF